MALIKIKQINNSPASAGNVITFDGTNNVWAAPADGSLTIVTSFAGLPGSPATNDIVFYAPFQSTLMFDGSDWVSSKRTEFMFGRHGSSNSSVYMRIIARSDAAPTGGSAFALMIPNVAGGGSFKIYGFAVANERVTTGDMELHVNATIAVPVFGTTGIGTVISFVAATIGETTFPGVKVSSGSFFQCFWRRTSGSWRSWNISVTYAFVAE